MTGDLNRSKRYRKFDSTSWKILRFTADHFIQRSLSNIISFYRPERQQLTESTYFTRERNTFVLILMEFARVTEDFNLTESHSIMALRVVSQ